MAAAGNVRVRTGGSSGPCGIARIDPLPASGQAVTQTAGIFHERDFQADPAMPSAVGNGSWRLQPVGGLEQPLLLVYHP